MLIHLNALGQGRQTCENGTREGCNKRLAISLLCGGCGDANVIKRKESNLTPCRSRRLKGKSLAKMRQVVKERWRFELEAQEPSKVRTPSPDRHLQTAVESVHNGLLFRRVLKVESVA